MIIIEKLEKFPNSNVEISVSVKAFDDEYLFKFDEIVTELKTKYLEYDIINPRNIDIGIRNDGHEKVFKFTATIK